MDPVVVFPLRRYANDHGWIITLLALQGIVNRQGPRLLLEPKPLCDQPRADAIWRKIYAERYGLRYDWCRSVRQLLQRFSGELAGYVLYDEQRDATASIALTLAGLESLLPVCSRQLNWLPRGLPCRYDLCGRWNDNLEAWDWAVARLLPRTNPMLAHSLGHSHDDVDLGRDGHTIMALDYAVSRQGFVFNLSPCEGRDRYPDAELAGYPDDAARFREVLLRLQAPAAIYGWAEPEWTLTALLSDYNHYLMCGTAPNLSFHAALETGPVSLVQRGGGVGPQDLEDKVYLAFMTSEGDAPRIPTSFMYLHWLDRRRGTFPVNWGINPVLLEHAPAMMRYFYETATSHDYFFGGVGGAGYVFLDRVRDIDLYSQHARRHLLRGDIRVTDHWAKSGGRFPATVLERFGRFAVACDQLGMTHIARSGWEVKALSGGIPIVFEHESLVYYKGTPHEVADRVRQVVGSTTGPRFLLMFTNPQPIQYYHDIMAALGRERYVPVHLDVLMRLARTYLAQSGHA